ncbi:MAG: hypothetical protein RSD39_07260, partial [Oscillospiraceae bacterium]
GNGEFENAAMIIGNYRFSGGLRGGLGIVGPARMNYGFLVPRLKYMCDCLSHALVNPDNLKVKSWKWTRKRIRKRCRKTTCRRKRTTA